MPRVNQTLIRRACLRIRLLAFFILLAIPSLLVLFWSDPIASPIGPVHVVQNDLVPLGYLTPENITLGKKMTGLAISAVPALALMFAVFNIFTLMGLFSRGNYISLASIKALKNTGLGFVAFSGLVFLHRTALGLAFTLGNPAGDQLLIFSADGVEIFALLLGGVLLMITRAFEAEKKRAEEHALIV